MQTAGSASEYVGCLLRTTWARDRESQLDYIAPKTCSIGGDPMLTIGGKEHCSGARMNVSPLQVNASEPSNSRFHHSAKVLLTVGRAWLSSGFAFSFVAGRTVGRIAKRSTDKQLVRRHQLAAVKSAPVQLQWKNAQNACSRSEPLLTAGGKRIVRCPNTFRQLPQTSSLGLAPADPRSRS